MEEKMNFNAFACSGFITIASENEEKHNQALESEGSSNVLILENELVSSMDQVEVNQTI